jgi:hypothetical protein
MREVWLESRKCGVCGASLTCARGRGGLYEETGGGTFYREPDGGLQAATPRERSGLAYGAGFAGVLYLFCHSLGPLAFALAGESSSVAAALLLALSLPAPLALALSFAAAVSLDRARGGKSGTLPALFAYTAGMFGTVDALSVLARWANF